LGGRSDPLECFSDPHDPSLYVSEYFELYFEYFWG
jgi:hypothetical protein